MEINPVYNRYLNGRPSLSLTTRLVQDLINERLSPEYRKIRVEASNSGKVTFMFTIFLTENRFNEIGKFYYSYEMSFQDLKNFRNFRPDGELGFEVSQIENLIETFRSGCLSGIIL
jgi:hypothetical protein